MMYPSKHGTYGYALDRARDNRFKEGSLIRFFSLFKKLTTFKFDEDAKSEEKKIA